MRLEVLEELNLHILRLLKDVWGRVIALDLETHIQHPNMFLTDEQILSVSLARRISGKFMERNEIEVETIFLEDESEESEVKLLEKLNEKLSNIKPLAVIGYGVRQYDIPLLTIKKERYHKRHNQRFWKLVDLVELAAVIDLYHILRYRGYKKLEENLYSQEFSNLPLKRTKRLVSTDRDEKRKDVYRLWKEDRETLREYSEGDVHDLLLIAESLAFGDSHRERYAASY